MVIQKVRFYHQSTTNPFLRHRTKMMEIDNLQIKFGHQEIDIDIELIDINFYSMELAYPIAKIAVFYQFFPEWLEYHFTQKFLVDEKYREIYVIDIAKKGKVALKFNKIAIAINDSNISSSAIFLANQQDLENSEAVQGVIGYLKCIKKDLLTLTITGFTINIDSFNERKTNKSKKELIKVNEVYSEEHNYIANIIKSKTSFINL